MTVLRLGRDSSLVNDGPAISIVQNGTKCIAES